MLTLAISDIRRVMNGYIGKTELPMWTVAKHLNTVMSPTDWVQAVRRLADPERNPVLTRVMSANGIEFVIEGDPLTRRSTSTDLERIKVRSTREAS